MASPEYFGAVGDGIADDYAAVLSALNTGSVAQLTGGRTYRCVIDWAMGRWGLPMGAGLTVLTNGARINMEMAGNVYGIRPQSNSHIIGDGWIAVTGVSQVDSLQGINQSVISLGEFNGAVTDKNNEGPFNRARDWSIRGPTLSTEKMDGHIISMVGGVHSGLIQDIVIPDSSKNIGCIGADWGTVGPIGTIAQNRYNYDNGKNFFTVHPHDIVIERFKIGDMTHPNSTPIRFSACHGMTVRDGRIAGSRSAAISHYGGDFGYEFCEDGITRRRAYMGSSIRNVAIDQCNSGSALVMDCFADNIAREVGYVPIANPIYDTDILVDGLVAEGNFSGAARGISLGGLGGMAGGFIHRSSLVGFGTAIDVIAGVSGAHISGNRLYGNMGDGILVNGDDINIENNRIWANGAGATNAGIRLATGKRPRVVHNKLGYPGEGGQYYGIDCSTAVTDAFIFENYIDRVKSGGAAISKGNTVQIAWNFFGPSIPANRQII